MCFTWYKLLIFNLGCLLPGSKAAHMDVPLNDKDFILTHGSSKWIKPEKVSDLKRKGNPGRSGGL